MPGSGRLIFTCLLFPNATLTRNNSCSEKMPTKCLSICIFLWASFTNPRLYVFDGNIFLGNHPSLFTTDTNH